MFGSLLVLRALSLAEQDGAPANATQSRLRVVSSAKRKPRTKRAAINLPRAA
jgi:hypothetical protein